jgi:hypothetical protein
MSQINLTAGHPIFDTLGYFQRLKAAGFSEAQAQVQVDALREIVEDKLATKHDIHELKRDIQALEARLEVRLAETKAEIIKWMAGRLIAQAAVVAALVKLL